MTLRLRSGQAGLGVVAVFALMVASAGVLHARDTHTPLAAASDRWLYIRSPRISRLLAMNFSTVTADSYWLRTIQHFGGDRLSNRRDRPFELLYPLLDLTTALDPQFSVAYRFGAMFLSEPPPGGPGRPDQAIRILEKGLRASPERWQYAHDIGFVELWRGDSKAAASWFRRASAMPKSPIWLGPLAATTMMTGGDRDAAKRWLTDMRMTATEEWVRKTAERRLTQLVALDDIDALEAMVPVFQQKMHRDPTGWPDFEAAGLLKGLPTDPAGAPYVYFPASGLVRLHPQSPLGPLPQFPGAAR